ncbi:DM13 domain-containing protein [Tamlana agarivorans]|uniref:DM13 domain-containing protein n=1 Tax=Pseudotamlana agarivorans TaxID=481183 RepID=A0ACC5UBP1_9FLAO|nr:DM13 domain-containing protein [Tamlana agarivorans]MBU2951731.1 DM13 domain-containing protein [Tamlana agarivorans]
MKTYFLLFLSVICFTACSSDNDDSPMDTDEMESSYSGNFVSVAHPTSGKAVINEEEATLMLTNFKSDDGPSLELYLATDASASKYVSLGALKGLDGNYTYDLSANTNLDFSEYNHVIVWCVPFGVNFGNAILEMD